MYKNIKITSMNSQDLESIKNILNSDFDDFWNYNILKEELNNKNSRYLVAKLNNEVIGFAGIKIVIDEADIMNIVVKKNFRNNGIGSLLLENLINLSKSLNISSLSLEVNEKNISAISLYKKFNFKEVGKRKNYYKDSDAILMSINFRT